MAPFRALLASCAVLLACPSTEDKPAAKPTAAAAHAPVTPDKVAAPARNPEWTKFTEKFLADYFAAHPAFAVLAGKHEYDGKLPDWSREGIAAEITRMKEARTRASAFGDDKLNKGERMERDLLVARLERDLFWLDTAKWPMRSPAFYFDWLLDGLDPAVYVTREYAPINKRLDSYIAYAEAIPTAASQIKANLKGPLPATYIKYGVAGFGGLASYYENDVPQVFAKVDDAEQQKRFTTANAAAVAAMKDLAAHMEAQTKQATQDFALGAELFTQMVAKTEGLDVSLDALEAAGRADLKRNTEALTKACAQLVPDGTIPDCIAKVADEKPEGGPVVGARKQLEMLRAFMTKASIVTIPGTEVANVEESPPYMRQNSAYIDIPGPYEKGLPSTYFISPPDPAWSEAEQLAYIPGEKDLLFTSVHEVWPGHFLQYLHANRSESEVARVFIGYAYSEGWAHYTEEMMCEEGLCEKRPAVKVGQLLNALLRNARFLSAVGLHARGMTVEESEKLFREQAYQDAGNARQQAARGTYDPAYLNYTLGKLMILKLRADWTKSRGGRKAHKEFHDTFLSYGGPPIPQVRRAMLGEGAGPSL